MYRFYRGLARLVVWLFAPLRFENRERLPQQGPLIIVANHRSLLDGFIFVALFRQKVGFLSAAYLFQMPIVGWILRDISVPTGSVAGVRQLIAALEAGGVVALFPEGGVRTEQRLDGLGDIAAYLATKTGAPVVPVAIHGATDVLPVGKYLPRRRPVRLVVGESRRLEPGLKRGALLEATTEWMAEIFAMEPRP